MPTVTAAYRCGADETAEALAAALADPDDALAFYRRAAQRLAVESPPPDAQADDRRRRVLDRLARNPDLRLAVVCDGDGDPAVPIAVGIRDGDTCRTVEVLVPAERFDPFLLIDLVKRHGSTLH